MLHDRVKAFQQGCRHEKVHNTGLEHNARSKSATATSTFLSRQRARSMSNTPFSTSVVAPSLSSGRPMHRCLSDQSGTFYRPSATTARQPASVYHSHLIPEEPEPIDQTMDGSEDFDDDYTDMIHLSRAFQLLLVSRRVADAAVQTLWKGLVFHGHDPFRVMSLLQTLQNEDGVIEPLTDPSTLVPFPVLQRLKEVSEEENEISDRVDSLMATQGRRPTNEQMQAQGVLRMNPGAAPTTTATTTTTTIAATTTTTSSAATGNTASLWLESLSQSMRRIHGTLTGQSGSSVMESSENNAHVSSIPNLGQDTTPANLGPTRNSKNPRQRPTNFHRRHSASGDLESTRGFLFSHASGPHQSTNGRPRWSYRRFVKRVVLNFTHPQASPHLLVQVLETLGSRCRDQIQELDLHANEKMRGPGSGLETTADLERLFGTGFKNLRCIRLQGGFLDNQLLSALIKGLARPGRPKSSTRMASKSSSKLHGSDMSDDTLLAETTQYPLQSSISPANSTGARTPGMFGPALPQPCRLSQVFLGPGSITDSAIEKLISAAGQSLQVFTVTSCVDVGGGALASLLTKCPNLRVLGVYRSLARDVELLEGLGLGLSEGEGHAVTSTTGSTAPHVANDTNGGMDTNIQSHGQKKESTEEPTFESKIIAPLERLELGTVKLTTVGVSEVLKGVCTTLRFLVLETRHFKEEFLRDVIVPHCKKLEGLYFDDLEYLQRMHQRGTGATMGGGGGGGGAGGHTGTRATQTMPVYHHGVGGGDTFNHEAPPPPAAAAAATAATAAQQQQRGVNDPNRFFEFGRSRWDFPGSRQVHGSSHEERPPTRCMPRVSPWLGDTSTQEWVERGDCALWASAPASAAVCVDGNGSNGTGAIRSVHGGAVAATSANAHYHHSYYQHQHHANGGANQTTAVGSEGSVAITGVTDAQSVGGEVTEGRNAVVNNSLEGGSNGGGFYSMTPFVGDYGQVLGRFNVEESTVELVTQSLERLQKFTVMQMVLVTDTTLHRRMALDTASAAHGGGDVADKSSEEEDEQQQQQLEEGREGEPQQLQGWRKESMMKYVMEMGLTLMLVMLLVDFFQDFMVHVAK
ncbi:hypothetical protein BGZ94_004337 [Podila epigama]|nr:hypothetical protein BGZ94_004337 [Podila epigama]